MKARHRKANKGKGMKGKYKTRNEREASVLMDFLDSISKACDSRVRIEEELGASMTLAQPGAEGK